MTIDEYKEKINGIITNADTAPVEAANLITEIEADFGHRDADASKISELEAKVKDLQDTNMKLYLNVAGTPEEEPDDEPATGLGVIDEFIDKVLNEKED